MDSKRLYRKHHGLPGAPMSSGRDGVDGTAGNNIYFGYVGDFFEGVEMTVDNLVRVARRRSGTAYYSGVFTSDGADQASYTAGERVSGSTLTHASGYNIFKNIYDIEDMYRAYDYDESTRLSNDYVKVDVLGVGKSPSGSPDRWNTVSPSPSSKWKLRMGVSQMWDGYVSGATDTRNFAWPYSKYPPSPVPEWADIKPGKIASVPLPADPEMRKHTLQSLFTVSINGRSYAFTSARSGHYNSSGSVQWTFGTTDARPSVSEIIAEYEARGGRASVDYAKSGGLLTEKVTVTDRLKSRYRPGDVLYFYTDRNGFSLHGTVEYMVTITPALVNCTLDDLIAAADIHNPFSFKSIDSVPVYNRDYLLSQKKSTAVRYAVPGAGQSAASSNGKKFAYLTGYSGDSMMNIGLLSEKPSSGADSAPVVSLSTLSSGMSISDRSGSGLEMSVSSAGSTRNTLKIRNPYFRNSNCGNVEMSGMLLPNEILADASGVCHTLTEDEYSYRNKQFTVDPEAYFRNVTLATGSIGAVVVTYDMKSVAADRFRVYGYAASSKTRKFTFGRERGLIKLTEDYLTDTGHMIMVYVQTVSGLTYWSRPTLAQYDVSIKNYDISVFGDMTGADEENTEDTPVKYVCTGISADKTDSGVLDVYLPATAITGSVRFFMNSEEITGRRSNSWCALTFIPENDPVEPDIVFKRETVDGHVMLRYRFNVAVDDNIPQITAGTDCETAKEYNADSGVDNVSDGCEIFSAILNGEAVNTAGRYVTVSVKYTDMLDMREKKSVYRLEQAGYVEKRAVPKVNLKLLKGLNELESSNSFSNGVLCNQFQFFVDVDVDDFSSDIWGTYVPEDDILLNFDIKSTPIDYDFVTKYGVTSSVETYTVHGMADSGTTGTDNYCRVAASVVDNAVGDVFGMTQKEIESFVLAPGNPKVECVNEVVVTGAAGTVDRDGLCYRVTDATFSAPNKRDNGIMNITTIRFRNLTFSDVKKGKFRIRVLVEFGNPVLSRLFFRYYVSDMYVMYAGRRFSVGTSVLAKQSVNGRVMSREYMFATETFYAYVCPVSLTAVPSLDSDGPLVNTSTQLMTGSVSQLDMGLNACIPDRFSKEVYPLEQVIEFQLLPWYEFDLKLRYLQDNVSSVSVSPVQLKDFIDRVASFDGLSSLYDELKDAYKFADSYMSVTYNANAFGQITVDDERVFTYNGERLKSSGYSQFAGNAPCFTTQSAAYCLRSADLLNSMNLWNAEYKFSGSYADSLTGGHLNTYGNAYMYTDDSADTGQFKGMSLADIKAANEKRFFYSGDMAVCEIEQTSGTGRPDAGKWYKSLLYQAKWQYPKYFRDENQKDRICAYDIRPVGSFITRASGARVMPYNLAYEIYPRCAWDDEHDVAVVFMLRCPTVKREGQYAMRRDDLLFTADASYPQIADDGNLNVL